MATMFSAIENNNIIVGLVALANTTGWSLPGDGTAVHVACNPGFLTLKDYPIVAGKTYKVTYTLISGTVTTFVGNHASSDHSIPGVIIDVLLATNNDPVKIYSETDAVVSKFAAVDVTTDDPLTIVFSVLNKKWSDYRKLYPEFGASINQRTIVSHEGAIYVQENGSQLDRNNFFGTQYTSLLTFVEAKDPELLKTYNSLVIQGNQVMVTTPDGITTPLGQVSELAEIDFVKGFLSDGTSQAVVESVEGVYSASFLRDKNEDLENGAQLKGNYIIISLTKTNPAAPLKIFTIAVNSSQSKIGVR